MPDVWLTSCDARAVAHDDLHARARVRRPRPAGHRRRHLQRRHRGAAISRTASTASAALAIRRADVVCGARVVGRRGQRRDGDAHRRRRLRRGERDAGVPDGGGGRRGDGGRRRRRGRTPRRRRDEHRRARRRGRRPPRRRRPHRRRRPRRRPRRARGRSLPTPPPARRRRRRPPTCRRRTRWTATARRSGRRTRSTRAGSRSISARRPSCAASKSTGRRATRPSTPYRPRTPRATPPTGRRSTRRPPAPAAPSASSCRAATSRAPPLRHRARAAVWAPLPLRVYSPDEAARAAAAPPIRPPTARLRGRRPRDRSRARGDERERHARREGAAANAVDGDAATCGARRATRTR